VHFSSLLYTPTQKSDALLFALLRLKKAKVHDTVYGLCAYRIKKALFLAKGAHGLLAELPPRKTGVLYSTKMVSVHENSHCTGLWLSCLSLVKNQGVLRPYKGSTHTGKRIVLG
jgi:hypothetical protein|tara:strand:+ start:76 stop:417 length:342 start_codon:yes stop_codon:yes gene_type:complete